MFTRRKMTIKKIIISLAVVLFLGGVVAGGNWYLKKDIKEEKVVASEEEIAKGNSAHSKKITGAQTELLITDSSPQSEIMAVMHQMTHQKIQANEKWGAIPMIQENIDQVYEIIEANDFQEKDILLPIISRWKDGNFNRVDKDHNAIWKLQGGSIGKAYGIMSEEEERWFVIKNFQEDVLTVWLEENK
jgi:predicted RND superfamily exporter protein